MVLHRRNAEIPDIQALRDQPSQLSNSQDSTTLDSGHWPPAQWVMLKHELDSSARPPVAGEIAAPAKNGAVGQFRTKADWAKYLVKIGALIQKRSSAD